MISQRGNEATGSAGSDGYSTTGSTISNNGLRARMPTLSAKKSCNGTSTGRVGHDSNDTWEGQGNNSPHNANIHFNNPRLQSFGPELHDALSYIARVRREFHDSPNNEYNKFVLILKDVLNAPDTKNVKSKNKNMTKKKNDDAEDDMMEDDEEDSTTTSEHDFAAKQAAARISKLFHGHDDLILGFNNYLPNEYKIDIMTNKKDFLEMSEPGQEKHDEAQQEKEEQDEDEEAPSVVVLVPQDDDDGDGDGDDDDGKEKQKSIFVVLPCIVSFFGRMVVLFKKQSFRCSSSMIMKYLMTTALLVVIGIIVIESYYYSMYGTESWWVNVITGTKKY